MNNLNERVWKILSDDERTALTLALSFDKSSWEAGEIMKKAHFKFLEIKERAEYFMQVFHGYLEKHGELFTGDQRLPQHFKEYLVSTLLERKNISQSIKCCSDSRYLVPLIKERIIMEEMARLRNSQIESEIDLYNLIREFDRWNNFRILPLGIQLPSAFKRRNKTRDLARLKLMVNIDKLNIMYLKERYEYTGKYPMLYLGFVKINSEDYDIFSIRKGVKAVEEITSIGLYLFENYQDCFDFCDLVQHYFRDKYRNCKIGLEFWPRFRELIKKSHNIDTNIIHRSRDFIKNAKVIDMEILEREKKVNARLKKVSMG